ncbi:FAD dependent oxidoreductase [Pimelobacter simplex]|uniref:FAD dependent oxidoreductase n=2 Tax=Nocardioides simplex TaxID=2045 RepID=A0A0A1DLV5_NOCSI|nr:FAD dependent oxidoreductase [Pimelobacter simplex]GEB13909.1 putative iron-sulfur binding oxidoreductase [Pimelobacter simplex]
MNTTGPGRIGYGVRMNPSHEFALAYDVAVVGGGLAGLLSALLLARAGRAVVVLEARQVGDGTTGHSTGKVSLLQGTKLSRVLRSHALPIARQYVEAGREGQAWLRHYCAEHGMPVEGRHATTYATTAAGERRARAELDAAQAAGLDAVWTDETELPFAVRGAVRLEDQLQVDPRAVLDALLDDVRAEGGEVREEARVVGVRRHGSSVRITTADGTGLSAGAVVVATNQPILDRGLFFARLQPERSYAATLSGTWVPEGMHLSSDDDTRSLRSARGTDDDGGDGGDEALLMIGGAGHVTGRGPASEHRARLLAWAGEHFPEGEVRATWSAQDQAPVAALPYAGPVLPGEHRIQVVTGFDKWGFSTAPAAALVVAAELLGGRRPGWAEALRTWAPPRVRAAARTGIANAEVGWHLACGHLRRPFAQDRPPLCTHLGGVLAWNDVEESWDCPLHGSRFAADGTVLEGPATRPLTR